VASYSPVDSPRRGPEVRFEGVWKSHGEKAVLAGTSFTAPAGAITVLLGPSGVGKTTCLAHMVGLDVPDGGEVRIGGRSVYAMRRAELAALRRRSGVQLEGAGLHGAALWSSMTLLDNLRFQLREVTAWDDATIDARARERLAAMGLADACDQLPDDVSAGMRRRAAVARALAADPELVILDGPDLGVDPVRVTGIADVLLAHHAEHRGTFVVVTHDMELARRIADHVVVLLDGVVAAAGTPETVLGADDAAVRQLVTGGREGPLALATATATAPRRAAVMDGARYDVPLGLAALCLLVAMTGPLLFVGAASPVYVTVAAIAWILTGAVIAGRVLDRRRDGERDLSGA